MLTELSRHRCHSRRLLVPRPNTPVFENPQPIHFAIALEQELGGLITAQNCRRRMYRDAADEWPIGRTPPEVKEKRKAEVKALVELWDITSDDGSEADGLPTPPGSAERSVDISHTSKRRRITGAADDGETKFSARTRVRSTQKPSLAEEAVLSPPQVNVRKRRRVLDVDDEDDNGQPAKIQATVPRSPSIWQSRLRTRRPADVGEREEATRPIRLIKVAQQNQSTKLRQPKSQSRSRQGSQATI